MVGAQWSSKITSKTTERRGLAAAVIIGALAGLLPAIRAARLSPTEALLTV
jgi:ABC-type antimicrobial peptide transport system permease subunit